MIGQKRSIDEPEMLSLPWSLSSFVGNSCWKHLQNNEVKVITDDRVRVFDCVVDSAPDGGCVLLDAMAVLQSTVVLPETYGELADSILARMFATARKFNASRVDMVADRYPQLSIKNTERKTSILRHK